MAVDRNVVLVGELVPAENWNNPSHKGLRQHTALQAALLPIFQSTLISLRSSPPRDPYSLARPAPIMAIALDIVANVIIGLLSITVPLAIDTAHKGAHDTVGVEIGVGAPSHFDNAANLGGNIPKVTLFDEHGQIWGSWEPGKNEKISPGMNSGSEGNQKPISVKRSSDGVGAADPTYILLENSGNDAICIEYVALNSGAATYTWTGDTGYLCGGVWYQSTAPYQTTAGNGQAVPKCTWIDGDGSGVITTVAMSIHMQDWAADKGRLAEYKKNKDTMCKSKPRFHMWTKDAFDWKGKNGAKWTMPIFTPPLQYKTDDDNKGADKDMKAIFASNWYDTDKKRDVSAPVGHMRSTDATNGRPGHVVISDFRQHSAAELCSSATSVGPSFVSTQDGLYCDMSTKTQYPVCSKTITSKCFDVDKKQLIGETRRHARDVMTSLVDKTYSTHERWTPQ